MSNLWDFSNLFQSFNPKQLSEDVCSKYNDLTEEMKNQLDQISTQLLSIDSNDISDPTQDVLLTCPSGIPLISPSKNPFNTTKIQEDTKAFNLTIQQIQNDENHKIITPPSTERTAPRHNSRAKPKSSNSNLKQTQSESKSARSSKSTVSKNKTRVTSKLPPLKTAKSISNQPIFQAKPNELSLANFSLSTEYKFRFTLQNISSRPHGFQVRGPSDSSFNFRIIEKVNTSSILPGLFVTFEVTFIPTEPRDYDTKLIFITGDSDPEKDVDNTQTVVSFRCYRDPPQLEVPDLVDLKSTIINSSKSGSFKITNRGGIAFFCFQSKSGREDSLMYSDGPFTLIPSQFQLATDETIEITLRYKPTSVGKNTASFEIVPQHFPQRFYFITQGCSITPQLSFRVCPEESFLFLPFLPIDTNTTREVEIFNNSEIAFPFHIQILKPRESSKSILKHLYPDIDNTPLPINSSDDDNSVMSIISKQVSNLPFAISPLSGQLSANESMKIKISFTPKFYGFFRANLAIFADRIPDLTGTLGSKKMLMIGVEASSGKPDVYIQPPLVIFNSVVPNVSSKESLEVVNNSYLKVKLNWPQTGIVTAPNSPEINESLAQEKKTVELSCLLSKTLMSSFPPTSWCLFRRHPDLSREYMIEFRQFMNNGKDTSICALKDEAEKQKDSRVQSPCCAVSFKPNGEDDSLFFQMTAAEVLNEENRLNQGYVEEDNAQVEIDEMPNIFGPNKPSNETEPQETAPVGKLQNEVDLNVGNQGVDMKFSYLAHMEHPKLIVEPPVLDFGFILAGETGTQPLTLINQFGTPLFYEVKLPSECETEITLSDMKGVIPRYKSISIDVNLNVKQITQYIQYFTITSRWEPTNDDISMPVNETDVKILACIDRPLLEFEKRIINIGDIFPTLQYNAIFNFKLLNAFPTEFWINDYANTSSFERAFVDRSIEKILDYPKITEIIGNTQSMDETRSKSVIHNPHIKDTEDEDENYDRYMIGMIKTIQAQRSPTVLKYSNRPGPSNPIEIEHKTVTTPLNGQLDIGGSSQLNVSVVFSELGEHALPITVNVRGNQYTCLVTANVIAPKVTLVTEKIDFSDDFIICRRSEGFITVKNESDLKSTFRIEVVDDSHQVFQLHDSTLHEINPFESIDIPVSCYSEVHGDFYGHFKLIVRDLWQYKETLIPMHVKAQRSFFGFQTFTLGYTKWADNIHPNNNIAYSIINDYKNGVVTGIDCLDFIFFGIITDKSKKVFRSLKVENYSSESIMIDWQLNNFVKGRKYVDVSYDLDEEGQISLKIEENEEGKQMSPFTMKASRTEVHPHDKATIEIEFIIPEEKGTYRGVVAARCGEFTHQLGLVAICE